MKKIIALILAALFVFFLVLSVVMSIAYAADHGSRDETVYVDMDADGNITGIVSSVYLSNPSNFDEISDHTILTNIKCLSSNDSPAIDGDQATFHADGKDVIYQGTVEKELPFSVSVAYTLDGKKMSAQEMAGKSGHVTITLRTVNHLAVEQEVDGETVTLYTPFTVICMYPLNDSFRNITTDGKLNTQSGSVSVMASLMPGLAESLDDQSGDIHDTLTIEADVSAFRLDEATLIGVVGLVDESDLGGIDDVQDLFDALDKVEEATGKLADGAKELYSATGDFAAGTADLTEGAWDLAAATNSAAEGASKLTIGLGEVDGNLDALYRSLSNGASSGQLTQEEVGTIYAVLVSSTNLELANKFLAQMQSMSVQSASLTDAVYQLNQGTSALCGGANELMYGLFDLAGGADDLADGAYELSGGANDIRDGVYDLYKGIRKVNQDGMQKILDETSGYEVSLSRKDALLALSDAYTSYSSTQEQGNGSVQFMFTIDGAEEETPLEPAETAVPAQDTEGIKEPDFGQRIIQWFKDLFQ